MPNMLGHDLVGAFAQALATDPQPLPQPGGLVWQSSDAALRVASGLRGAQDKLPLTERVRQLEAAAALEPQVARDLAEAAMARLAQPVDPERAEAVRDLAACFPNVLAQQVAKPLERLGARRGVQRFPLSEEHPPATREAFYATLLPKRRPRFRPGEPVPHRDGFVFDALIGVGGFGEVWRVRERSGRVEAMKFCVDAAAARMIEREAETLTALAERLPRHTNLVAVTALNTWQPPYWLAFEYLAGGTLEAELASQLEPKPWPEVLSTFDRILQGVAAAHAVGIVHRDLKPGNVLLTAEGTPKVADFGLGKVLTPSESGPMQISAGLQGSLSTAGFGTLGYVAPEQQEGQPAEPADDVFALGVLLFHMLLGSSSAQPRYIREKLAALEPTVPPGVVEVIVACVDQPRGRRPKDAGALRELLRPHVPGLPPIPSRGRDRTEPGSVAGQGAKPNAERSAALTEPGAERERGRLALSWFLLMLLLIGAAGGAAYLWNDELRNLLGLAPAEETSQQHPEQPTEGQLRESARVLLEAARTATDTEALERLREIEAFLQEHGETPSLPAELHSALEAQRERLAEVVHLQAEAVAAMAVKWARTTAGHDPRGTLAELDALHERYGEQIVSPSFHAKRKKLAQRVAELGKEDRQERHERGPFAEAVERARERAAENAGVSRSVTDPQVPRTVASEDEGSTGDEPASEPVAVEEVPSEVDEEQGNDWGKWVLNTLLPAVLVGMVLMLILVILVGAAPLPL